MSFNIPNSEHNQPAILLENVSIHYKINTGNGQSFKGFMIDLIKKNVKVDSVKALDDVSMAIYKGEIFGIIGRNGAGKSTMLKVISRIISPTYGRIRVWGQVAPLLGVGVGFEMELTGRENIFLYSALLGRSEKRTRQLFDSMVDFAELSDFIDQPFRTYSSGMKARLGFAVAMAEIPEILVVDEVLGVGDEMFRAKCQDRFEEFQQSGATVVIVSHSAEQILKTCSRAMWLLDGEVRMIDKSPVVIKAYHKYYRHLRTASTTIRKKDY